MTQHDINLQEWADPENWSDGWIRAYFSKKDSRAFVPKLPRGSGANKPAGYPAISFGGTTINFGNPRGLMWCHILHLLVLLPFVLLFMIDFQRH
jgi:hypothetical protein